MSHLISLVFFSITLTASTADDHAVAGDCVEVHAPGLELEACGTDLAWCTVEASGLETCNVEVQPAAVCVGDYCMHCEIHRESAPHQKAHAFCNLSGPGWLCSRTCDLTDCTDWICL